MVELSDFDWPRWYERWEAMQNCYIPQRLYRFDLMLQLPDLPREAEVHILDLGCGPGSLGFRALQHYPTARVLGVDSDPILLLMGQQIAKRTAGHIQFLQADIREPGWWTDYAEAFDLVLSATALHWLNAEHLMETYQRVYQALKPGGWFLNSDHIASDSPEMQARYQQLRRPVQEAAFRATGAEDWDGFWQSLGRDLGDLELLKLRNEAEYWEGTDDGQPKEFHLAALRQCGFAQIAIHWQDLGEAVIGARKATELP